MPVMPATLPPVSAYVGWGQAGMCGRLFFHVTTLELNTWVPVTVNYGSGGREESLHAPEKGHKSEMR